MGTLPPSGPLVPSTSMQLKENPLIVGNRLQSIPETKENIYGKFNNDTFLKVNQFDVSSLAKATEETLTQNIINIILNGENKPKENLDKINLTNVALGLEEDLKILATPKIPLFNHMTLDAIKSSSTAHSDINKSVSQQLAETMAGITPSIIDPKTMGNPGQSSNNGLSPSELLNEIDQEAQKNLNQFSLADLVDKNINKSNKHLFTSQNMMNELIKCKMSAVYFIENYVSVPVAGGRVPIKESEQWNSTDKYKIIVDLFQQHDAVLYMSSRQSGKTTTSAMYLLWCMIFFPKIQISYLTLDKNRAVDMISRMKEMMDSLPRWMQVKPKSGAERLSYYELINGSKISASFVSGSNDPDKVGRGLSSPIVFIDETAFIPHADIVWGALQPSVSAAKIFAKKNGYPNGVIFTSTPNGAGANFFYNVYQNSVKFDDIYDYEHKKLHNNYQQEFLKPEKNSFISVVLHWSEFRSQEWYEQQRKDLNFNQRKISQELDLSFLGSDTCIFDDNIIAALIPKKKYSKITLPYGCEFDLYDEIDPNEKYYLGVDTAMSTGSGSDYSAMVLTKASDGRPIGEFHGRFSVVKRYAQVVKTLVKSFKVIYGLSSETLNVVIERNSIGKEVVEELIYDTSNFDFEEFLFYEETDAGERVPGLYTSNSGKMGQGKRDKMFIELMNYTNKQPFSIFGPLLIDELRNLEQKSSGRIEASKNQHDDIVMAWNFCLYARRHHIEKGLLFIKGETKGAKVDAQDMMTIMSTGTNYHSILDTNKEQEQIFKEINTEVLNKMAGITKLDLKEIEEERSFLLKQLAAEESGNLFGEIFSAPKAPKDGGAINVEDYSNKVTQNNYHDREEFDANDYFIL